MSTSDESGRPAVDSAGPERRLLQAKLGGRLSIALLKGAVEVFGVSEAGLFCDRLNRKVGFQKQPFHFPESKPENLALRSPPQGTFHAAFQRAAGNAE